MSENIFTEIYNKILSLFGQTTEKEDTKDVAINRLRLVLMQDRTNLTPEILQRMRKELIELLSKYVEMDKDALELNFEQDGEQMALMLSIPVVRAKDEEEIEAAIKASEDNKEEEENSDSEEENVETEDEEEETSENDDSTEETSEENKEESESEEETSEDENKDSTEEKESEPKNKTSKGKNKDKDSETSNENE